MRYTTEDLIKIYAKKNGWTIEDAIEAIEDAKRRPADAREYWEYITKDIIHDL